MEPQNQTGMSMFDSPLISKTTKLVIEENIQDNPKIRLVDNYQNADVIVYPTFLEYQRPDVKFSIGIFKVRVETVLLGMSIVFYEKEYDFYHTLKVKSSLVKDVRSNFYSMVDTETDFAGSLLYNLVKKTIDECVINYDSVIF
jgi:hypothetical protein